MASILFFLHLVQDLDLVYPLLAEAGNRGDRTLTVCLTDRLRRDSPRVQKALKSLDLEIREVSYLRTLIGFEPGLNGYDALVTAAESNARPHWAAHRLTCRANRKGLGTFTLQHGFEQPGLTYFDETYRPESFRIASQKILLWGDKSLLHEKVPASIRDRCVSVGWFKASLPNGSLAKRPEWGERVVLVSENLHRARYEENYRRRFIEDLHATATRFRHITFILKPHHNQRWLGRYPDERLTRLPNLVTLDSQNPEWEPYTAPAIVPIADAVISTPSTVVLDAAWADRPVAVVDDGLGLRNYDPLLKLESAADWEDFIRRMDDTDRMNEARQRSNRFVERVLVPGNAVNRILDLL